MHGSAIEGDPSCNRAAIVDFGEMARIIVMVVIGGLGSFIAPIIGAPPVYALNTWLAAWGEWSTVVFAAIVILIMRAYPAGLAGLISAIWRRRPGGSHPECHS